MEKCKRMKRQLCMLKGWIYSWQCKSSRTRQQYYRRTARFRQSTLFSITQVLFWWSCALTLRSRQQILFPQVSTLMQAGTYFPKVRRMLLFHALVILTHFWQASTLLHGHIALAIPSLPETDPQILERWGYAHGVHLDKCNRAKDFGLEFWCDVQ